MTTKADYTPEEWALLARVELDVGLAIACAAPSGPFGSLKELFFIYHSGIQGRDRFAANELIRMVWREAARHSTRADMEQRIQELQGYRAAPGTQAALETLRRASRQMAVIECTRVAELLDRKADPQEAAEFKRWLLFVAEVVARAAREHSGLSFGSHRVSDQEAATLHAITEALQVRPE